MPELQIRRLESAQDAHLCAELMSTSEPWLTFERSYEDARKLVTDPSREVYVAFDGDAFRGFLVLNLNGVLNGYIQTVAVAPNARGAGVGSQLVAFAEERIFRQSPNVFLCVSSFNTRAKQLYERLGYREVGALSDYFLPGKDEILMRKTLGPWRTTILRA